MEREIGRTLGVAALMALAACGVPSGTASPEVTNTADVVPNRTTETDGAPAPENGTNTVAETTDSRAELALQPITLEETRGKLPEELGCAFSTSLRAPALLIGKGFVQGREPSKAAVKRGGRVLVLTADAPGYEGLTAGPSFSNGSTLSVTIERGAKSLPGGFESQSWPASLVLRAEEGRSRTYADGIWSCGP